MKCQTCNGIGYWESEDKMIKQLCPKCYGQKEVDWIEEVLGVDINLKYKKEREENLKKFKEQYK
jgi:DnaJ-class molecular chaperone